MGKAKTASKNNPAGRTKDVVIQYKGKDAKPVLFIGEHSRYMAISLEDGSMACDRYGNPLPWASIHAQ